MNSRKQKEYLAKLLGDVKYSEKQVEKLKTKLPPYEARIKQALKAGNRDLAKQYALDYEQKKLEVKQAEQQVLISKKQYQLGKEKSREAASAEQMGKLAKNMNALADSVDVLTRDDDMLRKIEEEVAYSEAKLDIALESAGVSPAEMAVDLPPPTPTPEDILKEFE